MLCKLGRIFCTCSNIYCIHSMYMSIQCIHCINVHINIQYLHHKSQNVFCGFERLLYPPSKQSLVTRQKCHPCIQMWWKTPYSYYLYMVSLSLIKLQSQKCNMRSDTFFKNSFYKYDYQMSHFFTFPVLDVECEYYADAQLC